MPPCLISSILVWKYLPFASMFNFFVSSPKDILKIVFRERGMERERERKKEKHHCERWNSNSLLFVCALTLTGNGTCNLFGLWNDIPTEHVSQGPSLVYNWIGTVFWSWEKFSLSIWRKEVQDFLVSSMADVKFFSLQYSDPSSIINTFLPFSGTFQHFSLY